MAIEQLMHFSLNVAALCADCGEVGNRLDRCACCGSTALLALARVSGLGEIPPAARTREQDEQDRKQEDKRASFDREGWELLYQKLTDLLTGGYTGRPVCQTIRPYRRGRR